MSGKKIETTETSIKLRRRFIGKELNPPDPINHHEGLCLWCGSKLRVKCYTKTKTVGYKAPRFETCCGKGWTKVEDREAAFACNECGFMTSGDRVTKVVSREPAYAGFARGDYGDNAFCGLRCGYQFAVEFARMGSRLRPVNPSGK